MYPTIPNGVVWVVDAAFVPVPNITAATTSLSAYIPPARSLFFFCNYILASNSTTSRAVGNVAQISILWI